MAPTLTVPSLGSEPTLPDEVARTWLDRVVRPMTEEEENYEVLKVQRNARSNLKVKGKQNIQLTRKSTRQYNSYDQI